MIPTLRCQSCESSGLQIFYEALAVPIHNSLLVSSRQEALDFPTGDIRLSFCSTCGFIQNSAFDLSLMHYSPEYEDTQAYSLKHIRFARELAQHLLERYDLRGKDILEIGCGKGDFLILICELGGCRGIGFDPAYSEGAIPSSERSQVRFVRDLYSESYRDVSADLVCCRHTLEHIPNVRSFVQMVRSCLEGRSNTVVFFEVPDTARILDEEAFWDIYYEHCAYFTLGSLARLFSLCGFDLLDLRKSFGNQYLLLEAKPAATNTRLSFDDADLAGLQLLVQRFAQRLSGRLAEWREKLHKAYNQGQRVVLWGGGSKAAGFLTSLGIREEIQYIVDINPKKQGGFLPGTGQEIVGPAFLSSYRPDRVILMNPIYQDEVAQDINNLGITTKIEVL